MDRLDKFLCDSGAGTRSQVKAILKAGRVTVDGLPEKDGSRKIDPQTQTVTLDGALLAGKRRLVVMLNKPAGFVTATEDAEQKTVMELLPKQWAHLDLKPVGRLDKETEGLLPGFGELRLILRLELFCGCHIGIRLLEAFRDLVLAGLDHAHDRLVAQRAQDGDEDQEVQDLREKRHVQIDQFRYPLQISNNFIEII